MQRHVLESFLLHDEEEVVFSSRFNFPRPLGAEGSPQEDGLEIASSTNLDFDCIDNVFYPAFFASQSWCGATPVDAEVLYDSGDVEHVTVNLDSYGVSSQIGRLASLPRTIYVIMPARKSSQATDDVALTRLEHIFAPTNVVRHIDDYFHYWHRNSRVIHRPSFVLGAVSDPLLVGVALLGAMYSVHQHERRMAASVMQYAEEYIFDHLPAGQRNGVDYHEQDEIAFQSIQAALCMIVIQFWTGDAESKDRTMTIRFSQVIEVRSANAFSLRPTDMRTSAGLPSYRYTADYSQARR